jgi:site-specific DNA-methyltransferase (adenine-specific)
MDEWRELAEGRAVHTQVLAFLECLLPQLDDHMAAYLCFMTPRLIEMHRVLKDTGSIYVHCDPTASHYLKCVMDAVFGAKQFRNDVIWCYKTSGRSKRNLNKKHDSILFYAKTNAATFNVQRTPLPEHELKRFNKSDDGGRYYIDGKGYKYYQSQAAPSLNDWWSDIDALNSQAIERLGYPTQKPVALLERIIKTSSNEGDVVLDPFCGCGTTVHAAEKLGRNWIGVDVSMKAVNIMRNRLGHHFPGIAIEIGGVPETYEDFKYLSKHWDSKFIEQFLVTLVGGTPNMKKGADGGRDGSMNVVDADGKNQRVLISVKSGKQSVVNEGSVVGGALKRNGCQAGLIICESVTKEARRRAEEQGRVDFGFQRDFPKVQFVRIKDLFKGTRPNLPHRPKPSQTEMF